MTGVRAGWAIEPRKDSISGCRRRRCGRKAIPPVALVRELLVGPARSENPGTYGTFMRENREIPCLPSPARVAVRAAGGTLRR